MDPKTAAVNPYNLAQRSLGTAHVVVISGPQAFRLSDVIGKRLSVFRRAVRTYLPAVSVDDDPYRHPLALASQIADWQGKGPDAFANTLISMATRNSATSIDDTVDLPLFTKAKQIELQQQREVALHDQDYPALLALADQELKEKQREIEALESMVTEEEKKRSVSDARASDLESTNLFLRGRLVGLEKKIISDLPTVKITYPRDLESIEDWADEYFLGRLKITPRAQRDAKDAAFLDIQLVYRCLEYLATEFWEMKTEGGNDLLQKNADTLAGLGVHNESSGAEHLLKEQGGTFEIQWGANNRKRLLDMHLQNGGNTRDPARCLRIYYFWDDDTQQVVVGSLPSHLNTRAS
ncbi:hypothetical protein [Mesorhizobium sp. WSM1497]|uniref:hypothetical protein n=1 Tax=Mesorhizobium sp. WSM1497 TaxID=278153 RepID=UPI000A6F1778|nr:hypothetical protein [Mesorhizobium sp. WSM1497]